jgi:hypothetical protein
MTALRSHVNFPRFVEEFAPCIDRSFQMYYAIARHFSNVAALQFERLCERVELPLARAPQAIQELFDPSLIETVYSVEEYAFHAGILRNLIAKRLEEGGVEVSLDTEVVKLGDPAFAALAVECRQAGNQWRVTAGRVFNCTYAGLNQVLLRSGRQIVPLKYELAEIPLIEVPGMLRGVGITVMCGPFFSVMPFPAEGLHSLSHVRYTPHCQWSHSTHREFPEQVVGAGSGQESNYRRMLLDVKRYVPLLQGSRHVRSLWETKALLPRNEIDDGRPILFHHHPDLPGVCSVLGAKIDNVYDALDVIDQLYALREAG